MQKELTSLLGLIYLSLITFETGGIKIEVLFSKLKIFAILYKLEVLAFDVNFVLPITMLKYKNLLQTH